MDIKILIVDSVSSYREEVAEQLEQMGYEALGTENCDQALEAIRNDGFDLIVIDNDLPGLPGIELIPKIRDFDKTVQLVLVVEATFEQSEHAEIIENNNVSRLVQGPISPQSLVHQIESILKDPKMILDLEIKDEPKSNYVNYNVDSEHIKAVRRSYQEKLPSEFTKMEEALVIARDNPTKTNLEAVHAISHTIRGTAGTLNFNEISAIAGEIDDNIKAMLDGKETVTNIWEEIFNCVKKAEAIPERQSLIASLEPQTNNIATILVAGKTQSELRDISVMANACCFDVIPAASVDEINELAEKRSIDGVIIDLDFSDEISDVQIVQDIRNIHGFEKLPIAIMSDNCSVENRVTATHLGALHFLTKPIDGNELSKVVQEFIASQSSMEYKVLIVDDDEPFREHISAILKEEGITTATIGDPKLVLEKVDSFRPDILLLDVIMPEISGFDICRMLRSTVNWKEIPILFLTIESDSLIRLECFQAGGDDYIEKPVIKEELLARIGARLERIRLFRERSDFDALTTLPTRRAFVELFKLRVAEGTRHNKPTSLCLIDIDNFKYVNDTYGHLTGDRVLASLGKLLNSRFRSIDVRGRWGGEEFTVVFYGEEKETAKMILLRVLDEFSQILFQGEHDEAFCCTFSCGISELKLDGKTMDDLFRVADKRLYIAKNAGRNQIVCKS